MKKKLKKIARDLYRELAFQSLLAMGRTAPNPPVGCVAAFQAEENAPCSWIGGATEKPGKRHAEIVCLDSYHEFCKKEKKTPQALRLYLSLEPCSEQGRTPACTERILSEPAIRSLLLWERDPLQKRSALDILKQKGYKTRFLIKKEAERGRALTRLGEAFLGGFLGRAEAECPRFHFKLASSKDGLMGLRGQRLPISQPPALALGHLLRAKFDAVLVGMGTILSDQPRLDLRWGKKSFLALSAEALETRHSPKNGKRESRDVFFQTLFRELERLSLGIEREALEYQPERVFVLGSYSHSHKAKISDFLALQERLARETGKEALFLVEESQGEKWRRTFPKLDFYAELPERSEKEKFAETLRKVMARRGYNEVLIEGGAGIFRDLLSKDSLEKGDRIYLLRSSYTSQSLLKRNKLEAHRTEDLIFIDSFMGSDMERDAPIFETYELGEDSLELRALKTF